MCWPHRISLHTLCGLAAVVTHHIVGLWRVFGLKSCRQRVVLMVWREDAWTLDGFRESRRARGSKIEAGAVGAWATSPLARSANWQACPNTNTRSHFDDLMHLRDSSRQQDQASRTLTHFNSPQLQLLLRCAACCAKSMTATMLTVKLYPSPPQRPTSEASNTTN